MALRAGRLKKKPRKADEMIPWFVACVREGVPACVCVWLQCWCGPCSISIFKWKHLDPVSVCGREGYSSAFKNECTMYAWRKSSHTSRTAEPSVWWRQTGWLTNQTRQDYWCGKLLVTINVFLLSSLNETVLNRVHRMYAWNVSLSKYTCSLLLKGVYL